MPGEESTIRFVLEDEGGGRKPPSSGQGDTPQAPSLPGRALPEGFAQRESSGLIVPQSANLPRPPSPEKSGDADKLTDALGRLSEALERQAHRQTLVRAKRIGPPKPPPIPPPVVKEQEDEPEPSLGQVVASKAASIASRGLERIAPSVGAAVGASTGSATLGATAASLTAVAAQVAAALGPVSVVLGTVAIGAYAAKEAFQAMKGVMDDVISRVAQFSGALTEASVERETRMLEQEAKAAKEVGSILARYYDSQTDMALAIEEIKVQLIKIFGPLITVINGSLVNILEGVGQMLVYVRMAATQLGILNHKNLSHVGNQDDFFAWVFAQRNPWENPVGAWPNNDPRQPEGFGGLLQPGAGGF